MGSLIEPNHERENLSHNAADSAKNSKRKNSKYLLRHFPEL